MKITTILCASSLLCLSGCTAVTVPVPAFPIPGYTPNSELARRPVITQPYHAVPVAALPQTVVTPPATLVPTAPATLVPTVRPAITRVPTPTVIPATAIATFTPPTLKPGVSPKRTTTQTQTTIAVIPPLTHQPVSGKMNQIAQRIFQNETSGDPKRLIHWKDHRNFASLGIGQFIWYPSGTQKTYTENFPTLLKYIADRGTPLPRWLAQSRSKANPWPNKQAFLKAQNDRELLELRNFLKSTLGLQAEFMAKRLNKTLPAMLNQVPSAQRPILIKNYQTVANSPAGLYALIDYLHFQGNGTNPAERYNGRGWGLLQVLQNMQSISPGPAAVAEFMRSADDTLVTRVANSPAEKREARWLSSWQKRIRSYNTAANQVNTAAR